MFSKDFSLAHSGLQAEGNDWFSLLGMSLPSNSNVALGACLGLVLGVALSLSTHSSAGSALYSTTTGQVSNPTLATLPLRSPFLAVRQAQVDVGAQRESLAKTPTPVFWPHMYPMTVFYCFSLMSSEHWHFWWCLSVLSLAMLSAVCRSQLRLLPTLAYVPTPVSALWAVLSGTRRQVQRDSWFANFKASEFGIEERQSWVDHQPHGAVDKR